MNLDLFPTRIYKYNLNSEELKNKLINRYYSWRNLSVNETPEGWSCDVRTEFHGAFPFEYSVYYEDIVKQWRKDIGLRDKPYINEIWMNAYEEQQFQESHTHLPGFFSGIHYVMFDPEVHESTVFQNPQESVQSFMFDESFMDPNLNEHLKENYQPDIQEGDIIFFPSHLRHFVKRNTTNQLRMTVSFNINRVAESTRRVFA